MFVKSLAQLLPAHLIIALWLCGTIQATTFIVDPTGTYTTIQSAYTAAATSGDTILLKAGYTYTGSGNRDLSFSKSFTLTMTNSGAMPIVDINGSYFSHHFFCSILSGYTVYIKNIVIKNGYGIAGGIGGGALYNAGTLNTSNCMFINNLAYFCQGGVLNNSGTYFAYGCTFTGNTSVYGVGGARVQTKVIAG